MLNFDEARFPPHPVRRRRARRADRRRDRALSGRRRREHLLPGHRRRRHPDAAGGAASRATLAVSGVSRKIGRAGPRRLGASVGRVDRGDPVAVGHDQGKRRGARLLPRARARRSSRSSAMPTRRSARAATTSSSTSRRTTRPASRSTCSRSPSRCRSCAIAARSTDYAASSASCACCPRAARSEAGL